MKVLLFGICFVGAVFTGSFVFAQAASNAGNVQGVTTPDSVACDNPDVDNPYPTHSLDNSLSPFSGGKKLNSVTDGQGKPDDGSGIH